MSQDFGTIIGGALAYSGQRPYGTDISLGRSSPVQNSARIMKATIRWLDYGASTDANAKTVFLDLGSGQQVTTPINIIRSIYVDNTFSLIPIYVYFPDTGFTYVCEANSVLQTPVLTNNLQAYIYAEGFITGLVPETVIGFTDQIIPPLVLTTTYEPPVVATVLGSYTGFSASPGGTTFSVPNVALGIDAPDRLIAISVIGICESATTLLQCNNVTLAANNMSFIDEATQLTPTSSAVSLWSLVYPSGTNVTVLGTFNQNITSASLTVISLKNYQNPAPTQVLKSSGAAQSRSLAFTMANGSACLLGATTVTAGVVAAPQWTNALSFMSIANTLPPPNAWLNAAGIRAIADQTRVITLSNASAMIGAVWR